MCVLEQGAKGNIWTLEGVTHNIMASLIFLLFTKYYRIKEIEDAMDGECSRNGSDEKYVKVKR
jgi:hypothetical protein